MSQAEIRLEIHKFDVTNIFVRIEKFLPEFKGYNFVVLGVKDQNWFSNFLQVDDRVEFEASFTQLRKNLQKFLKKILSKI